MREDYSNGDQTPGIPGVSHELRRLKVNGSASIAELREFLGQMRGKRPQEVLGVIAQSSLFASLFYATVLVALTIGVLTVVPYGWNKLYASPAPAATVAEEPAAPAPAATPAPDAVAAPATATPAAPAVAAPASVGPGAPANIDPAALRRLGVGEVREANPLLNPLEDKNDDILGDLNKSR